MFSKDRENYPASEEDGCTDKLYQWERDPGRLVTLLSKEEGEQNFKLPVLPNGQPTPGNNHSTPLAVIHFDEDLLVNFTPRCFVRSIEDGDYLSNSGVSCRERLILPGEKKSSGSGDLRVSDILPTGSETFTICKNHTHTHLNE